MGHWQALPRVPLLFSMRMTRLIYTELVPEIAQEPNYDAALAALK